MKPYQLRRNRRETIRRLSLSVLAALFFSVVGYFLLVATFPLFSRSYLGTVDWNMLGTFVSVVTLALFAGGFVFALAEYTDKEHAKHREKAKLAYEIYQAIFEMLTAPEHEAARRWILANIPVKEPEEEITHWYEKVQNKIMKRSARTKVGGLSEGQTAVKLTLNCFDYIGFIARHYWDIDDDSLDWISPPIAKVWKRIGPYVDHVRTLRNASDYYLSAEEISDRCIEWRKKRGLPDEEYVKESI
jgi:hypothetical protein